MFIASIISKASSNKKTPHQVKVLIGWRMNCHIVNFHIDLYRECIVLEGSKGKPLVSRDLHQEKFQNLPCLVPSSSSFKNPQLWL